ASGRRRNRIPGDADRRLAEGRDGFAHPDTRPVRADAGRTRARQGTEPVVTEGPVLAVFGHPDDAEIAAGGTLAKWCADGREVHLLVLTNGDRGAPTPIDRAELAATRKRETAAAGDFLGLAGVTILDHHDGELENTPDVRREIVRTVRTVRPQIVLSCDPTVVFFGNRYFNH